MSVPVITIQAQFSDNGMSITVRFSSEGSSSSRLLDPGNATSGSGPGSCSSILDTASVELLGRFATCKEIPMSIPRGLVEGDKSW